MGAVPQTTTIILQQAPVAWLYLIDPAYASANLCSGTATKKFMFDNISDAKAKIIRPESVSNAEEFTEITRADGLIYQFPKSTIKVDGVSGAVKTGGAGTGITKGEISFSINAVPVASYAGTPPDQLPTYYAGGWQAFLETVRANLGGEWLAVIPMGYDYAGFAARGSTGKVAGYAAVIGTMGADIEASAASGSAMKLPITITGRQVGASDLAAAAVLLATLALPKIYVYEGIEDGEQYAIQPVVLGSTFAAELLLGTGVFLPNA